MIPELLGSELLSQREVALKRFVCQSTKAVQALRVLCQVHEADRFRLEGEQEEVLEQEIKEGSSGRLDNSSGRLCEISGGGLIEFSHHGKDFRIGLKKGAKTVRGFHFEVNLDGWDYECIVFDGGGSCQYYDLMSSVERDVFLQEIANRRRSSTVYIGKPPLIGFTAFFRDTPKGFVIEGFFPSHSIGNQ